MNFVDVKPSNQPLLTEGARPGSNGSNGSNGKGHVRSEAEKPDLSSYRMIQPNRIAQFIQANLIGEQPGGRPARLSLRHVNGPGNQGGQKIGDQDISNFEEENIGALAIGLFTAAENDAIGLGGEQKYVIYTYLESELNDPASRLVFTVNPEGDKIERNEMVPRGMDGGGELGVYMDSNPPTGQGVLGQVMRQNQLLNQQIMAVMASSMAMVRAAGEYNERLMKRVEQQDDQRIRNIETIEKARGESWQRERESKLLEAEIASKQELIGMAKMAVPAILRRLAMADPGQRIVADDMQNAQVALAIASDESLFQTIMEKLPNELERVRFAEWTMANVKLSEKIAESQGQRKPYERPAEQMVKTPLPQEAAAMAQAQAQQAAAEAAQRDPKTIAEQRAAELKKAQEQAEFWAQRAKSIEEVEAQAAAKAQEEAAAAVEAKPEGTEKAPKKAKAKVSDKPATPEQTEMPTTENKE